MSSRFDALYETSAAYRLMVDTIARDGMIALSAIYDATTQEGRPTPAEWLVENEDFFYEYLIDDGDGRIRADERAALDYLGWCDASVRVVCTQVIADAIEANPARAAAEGGIFGALFAKMELAKQGVNEGDARAGLVVDVMDRVEGLPPEEQARIVAETRRNVMATNLELVNPDELADEAWRDPGDDDE